MFAQNTFNKFLKSIIPNMKVILHVPNPVRALFTLFTIKKMVNHDIFKLH